MQKPTLLERVRAVARVRHLSLHTEQRVEDRAVLEYTAAAYDLGLARHERHVGRIEKRLVVLLYQPGRDADAREHLDPARMVFTRLREARGLAQVDETRAR